MPAGLSVLMLNDKCLKRSAGSYHSFDSLLKKEKRCQTPETPNVLGIYLLGKVCDELDIDEVRKNTEEKANLLYDYLKDNLSVKNKNIRSKTVIVIDVPDSKKVVERLSEKGFLVGTGYGKNKTTQIRIANYPQHKLNDIKKLLKVLQF